MEDQQLPTAPRPGQKDQVTRADPDLGSHPASLVDPLRVTVTVGGDRRRWTKKKILLAVGIAVLSVGIILTAVLVPISQIVGLRGSKGRNHKQEAPRPKGLALLVVFKDVAANARYYIPPAIWQYVSLYAKLDDLQIQVLRFQNYEVLKEALNSLKASSGVRLVVEDVLMASPPTRLSQESLQAKLDALLNQQTDASNSSTPAVATYPSPSPSDAQAFPTPGDGQSSTNTTSGNRRLQGARNLAQTTWPWTKEVSSEWYFRTSQTFSAQAENAWRTTRGDSSVVVAVIDTGVDLTHPDITANLWVNAKEIAKNDLDDDGNGYIDDVNGWNFAAWTGINNVYCDGTNNPQDAHGHGTNVAGIIAATMNSQGCVGGASNVKIMPLRVASCVDGQSIWMSDAVAAMDYASKMGAHIVSGSFGLRFGQPSTWTGPTSDDTANLNMMQQALSQLNAKGILMVAAAGNEAINLDQLTDLGYAAVPCVVPGASNLICVASHDDFGALSTFSNFGNRTVDIVAPGEFMYNLDIMAFGGYNAFDGTSQATPVVSATAALVLSILGANYGRNFTGLGLTVKDILLRNATVATPFRGMVRTQGRINMTRVVAEATSRFNVLTHQPAFDAPTELLTAGLLELYYSNPTRQFNSTDGLTLLETSTRSPSFPLTSYKTTGTTVLVALSGFFNASVAGLHTFQASYAGGTTWTAFINDKQLIFRNGITSGTFIAVANLASNGLYGFDLLISNLNSTVRFDLTVQLPGTTAYVSAGSFCMSGSSTPFKPPAAAPVGTFTRGFAIVARRGTPRPLLPATYTNPSTFNTSMWVPEVNFKSTTSPSLFATIFPGSAAAPHFGSVSTRLWVSATRIQLQVTCFRCKLYLNDYLLLDISTTTALTRATPCLFLSTTVGYRNLRIDYANPSSTSSVLAVAWTACGPGTTMSLSSLAPSTSQTQFYNPTLNLAGYLFGIQCDIWTAPTINATSLPTHKVMLPACGQNACPFNFSMVDILPGITAVAARIPALSMRCWAFLNAPVSPTIVMTPVATTTATVSGVQVWSRGSSQAVLLPSSLPELTVLEWVNLTPSTIVSVSDTRGFLSANTTDWILPITTNEMPDLEGVSGHYSTGYTIPTTAVDISGVVMFDMRSSLSFYGSYDPWSVGYSPTVGLNLVVQYSSRAVAGQLKYGRSRGFLRIPNPGWFNFTLSSEPKEQDSLLVLDGVVVLSTTPVWQARGALGSAWRVLYLVPGSYSVSFVTKTTLVKHTYSLFQTYTGVIPTGLVRGAVYSNPAKIDGQCTMC